MIYTGTDSKEADDMLDYTTKQIRFQNRFLFIAGTLIYISHNYYVRDENSQTFYVFAATLFLLMNLTFLESEIKTYLSDLTREEKESELFFFRGMGGLSETVYITLMQFYFVSIAGYIGFIVGYTFGLLLSGLSTFVLRFKYKLKRKIYLPARKELIINCLIFPLPIYLIEKYDPFATDLSFYTSKLNLLVQSYPKFILIFFALSISQSLVAAYYQTKRMLKS